MKVRTALSSWCMLLESTAQPKSKRVFSRKLSCLVCWRNKVNHHPKDKCRSQHVSSLWWIVAVPPQLTYTTRVSIFSKPATMMKQNPWCCGRFQSDLHQRWWIFQLYGLDILIKATMKRFFDTWSTTTTVSSVNGTEVERLSTWWAWASPSCWTETWWFLLRVGY